MIFFSMYIKCLSPWKPGMHQSQSYNKTVLFITAEDVKSLLRSCKKNKVDITSDGSIFILKIFCINWVFSLNAHYLHFDSKSGRLLN